jgi:carboxyl-terminal processing protease
MPKRNLAWILVIAMITLLMWQLPQTIAGRDAVYKAFGSLADVRAQIRKRFVDEVDDSELTGAAVTAGIKAMIEKLHDPYAVYFNPSEYDRFKNRTEGVFGGIGVDVWLTPEGLEIINRAPKSPASEADLRAGDVITHVDGIPTSKLSLVDAVNNYLNGPPGTEVLLTVIRPGNAAPQAPRNVKLERAMIHLDPVRGWSRTRSGDWRYLLDAENHIGYMRLTKFTHDLAEQMDAKMDGLLRNNLRGLILDLRENTGGLLDSARDVADRFLESGLIVRVAGRKVDEKQWFAMRDGTYPPFPMAVLINGSTASAAEIVAGALRDHKRAVVVGERSYGKGSVQEVVELDRKNGAIKLTTAYYYLPCGQCINRTPQSTARGDWGVTPTLPVPLSEVERANWLATWRKIGRDPRKLRRGCPGSRRRGGAVQRAKMVIEGDVQLRKALEYLQAQLRPTPPKNPDDSITARPALN